MKPVLFRYVNYFSLYSALLLLFFLFFLLLLQDCGCCDKGMILPPPQYDLHEMAREILLMFLWHLAPVVADVTLGVRHRVCFSNVLRSCGMLGNLTPSGERDVGWVCAHVSCWGAQTVHYIRLRHCHVPLPQDSSSYPKPKLYVPEMRQRQLHTDGPVRSVQHCDSKEGLSCFICLYQTKPFSESPTTLCDWLIPKSLIQNI